MNKKQPTTSTTTQSVDNTEHKWSKDSLQEITRRVRQLGRATGYALRIDNTKFDSHYGFIMCGHHVFCIRGMLDNSITVQYVIGQKFASDLDNVMHATMQTKNHERAFLVCAGYDNNPDGISFIASVKLKPADRAKLIAEYIFGVLVQDALLKATLAQLINSIIVETVHPKTLLKLEQNGYLQNSFQNLDTTYKGMGHRTLSGTTKVMF